MLSGMRNMEFYIALQHKDLLFIIMWWVSAEKRRYSNVYVTDLCLFWTNHWCVSLFEKWNNCHSINRGYLVIDLEAGCPWYVSEALIYISHKVDLGSFSVSCLSKLRLCSANHRAGYFNNLACDWLSIVWAYSEQETENGPWWNGCLWL